MFGGFLGMMVSEHFNNEDCMKTVQCPVFFIHGERDTLIPSNHSKHLLDVLKH
jgi:predicted esterase